VTDIAEDSQSLDATVDAAIQTCGGDARAAVRALIVANNYLEAEVKRLAEAVSSGFTRQLKIEGREQTAVQHSGDHRAGSWRDIEDQFPYSVDLVPPDEGFPEAVEDQIAHFLERLSGRYSQFVDLRGDDLLVRYCFIHEQDAAAFHAAFAGAAVTSRLKMAG
jgi:stage V sporulation protein SpoVS